MGRRKSRAKPAPKKIEKLDTVFNCPFCNHPSSVECKIDKKHMVGETICGIFRESFSTIATALTEPIDIYCEWIDERELVNTLGGDDEQ